MTKNPLKNKKIFIAGHKGMVGSALVNFFKKNEIKNLILISKKKLGIFIATSIWRTAKWHMEPNRCTYAVHTVE